MDDLVLAGWLGLQGLVALLELAASGIMATSEGDCPVVEEGPMPGIEKVRCPVRLLQ
ncbi:MAG: hypothetical protein HQ592_18635 [Planctomycetes bacterium]|nr:hypothetical protein [Planctomycetota bacterium]